MAEEKVVTTRCPICDATIEIPEYNMVTKTDALIGHIVEKHGCHVRPATPLEGPPLPRGLNIRWPGRKENE
jgi:hypothetical protein